MTGERRDRYRSETRACLFATQSPAALHFLVPNRHRINTSNLTVRPGGLGGGGVKQCPQTTLVFIQTTLRLSVAALLQRPGKVPKLPQQGGITRLIYVFAVEGGRGGGEGGGDGALYVAAPRDQALDRIGHLLRRRTSPLDRALAPLANALTCARALSPRGTRWGHLAQAVRVAPPLQRALLTPTPPPPATGFGATGWFLPFAGKLQTQKAVKRRQDRNKFHRTLTVFAERKFPENSWSFCLVAFPLSSVKNDPPSPSIVYGGPFISMDVRRGGKKKERFWPPDYRHFRITQPIEHCALVSLPIMPPMVHQDAVASRSEPRDSMYSEVSSG